MVLIWVLHLVLLARKSSDCAGSSSQALPCTTLDRMRQWRIVKAMVFIETPTFTRLITALLDDDEYSKLQDELVKRPDIGDLIKDGGGIRKFRWKRAGTGKSGGIRVIYYWVTEGDQLLMLVAYPKSVKDNLTDKETAILRKLVKEL